jgi:tRNA (mo5U34)-methyltransferase
MTLQSAATHDPEIGELAPWFHNLHLPDGRQTAPDHPLGDFPAFKWREIAPHLPADLSGWSALDIGCNAGYYSFELARRGADVTGLEVDPHYLRQARWVAKRYELPVDIREGSVYDLVGSSEQWDLVLFMGVLYHLRHPLLALDAVAAATRRLLVLQTLTMPGDERTTAPADLDIDERERMRDPGWPKMAFIERKLADDETNWWAPDAACVEAMARSAGLQIDAHPGHEIWLCSPSTA